MSENEESFLAIRPQKRVAQIGSGLARFSQDATGSHGATNRVLKKITGGPCVSAMAPFLRANLGCGLPKLRVKLRASGGRAAMVAKMGNH